MTLYSVDTGSFFNTINHNMRTVIILVLAIFAQNVFGWRSSLYPENWTPGYTDTQGRFLHDFSYAGYRRGQLQVPTVNKNIIDITKPPYNADNTGNVNVTAVLQTALDNVGLSGGGVVFLPAGTYKIGVSASLNNSIKIRYNNTILRGAGIGRTFIYNDSSNVRGTKIFSITSNGGIAYPSEINPICLIKQDIPALSNVIPLTNVVGFQVGDLVRLKSDLTQEFINEHNASAVWKVNDFSGPYVDRFITNVDVSNNTITVDAPTRYYLKLRDNSRVLKVANKLGVVRECGMEDISLGGRQTTKLNLGDSSYDTQGTAAYEVHASYMIDFNGVMNCWAKNIATYKPSINEANVHIPSNIIRIISSRFITIDSCDVQRSQYLGGGGNGYGYTIENAEDCLIKNSRAAYCRHNYDFKGPGCNGNVLLRCKAEFGLLCSDFHMWFTQANLIDNFTVNGDAIQAFYRPGPTNNHGYSTTESVFWNTIGLSYSNAAKEPDGVPAIIQSQQYGNGYVIGTSGPANFVKTLPVDRPWYGNIDIMDTAPEDMVEGMGNGQTLLPVSLYEDQLLKRLSTSFNNVDPFGPKNYLIRNQNSVAWNNTSQEKYAVITLDPNSSDPSLRSINQWIASTNFMIGDSVFVAAGDYQVTSEINFKKGVPIIGSFAGTEKYSSHRAKNVKPWDFINPTRILGVQKSLTDSVVAEGNLRIGSFSASDIVTLIDGVVFENGARSMKNNNSGGALNVNQGLEIRNCIFKNNATIGKVSNVSNHGGAIQCYSDAVTPLYSTVLTIKDCYFKSNQSRRQGGAINLQVNYPVQISGCYFEDNYTTSTNVNSLAPGGALNFESTRASGSIKLIDNTFIGNKVSGYTTSASANSGGAISVNAGTNAAGVSVEIERCKFINNMAPAAVRGGAVVLRKGTSQSVDVRMTNCLFQNNSGLNVLSAEHTDIKMSNITFVNNKGGLSSTISSTIGPKLYNSVIWGNKNAIGTLDEGIVGNWSEIKNTFGFFGSINPNSTNFLNNNRVDNNTLNWGLNQDAKIPFFENPAVTIGYDSQLSNESYLLANYKPTINSKYIVNKGDNILYGSVSEPTIDLNNSDRIADGIIDIGCYELATKAIQTITFNPIAERNYGDQDFTLLASASSGLPVTYTSSDNSILEINGNLAHIISAGSVTITATQIGNDIFQAAETVSQQLIINKINQIISFDAITDKVLGQEPVVLNAISSSGLAVEYTSSNTSVASITGNVLTLKAEGVCVITASQSGNQNYNAATSVHQTLNISSPCSLSNTISTNKNYTSSSVGWGNKALYAFDDIASTRWESASSAAGQWLMVDLGNISQLCKIIFDWISFAYAADYIIQVSSDGSNWQIVDSKIGYGGQNNFKYELDLGGLNLFARYVKVVCNKVGLNTWGGSYSINNFKVIGKDATALNLPKIVTDLENKKDIYKVYPIPTKDFIYIDIEEKIYSLSISNLLGNKILQVFNSNEKSISLQDLKPGIYMLSINNRITIPVIKQ